MSDVESRIQQDVMTQLQGALRLFTAYVGVVNGLFAELARLGEASAEELAGAAEMDAGYVVRWCDTAFAFELLDEPAPGRFALSDSGAAFLPDRGGTVMPAAVQAVLSAHMAERAAGLMPGGERPGERVLAERETILPWFGPMLERSFGPLLEREILAGVPAYREVDARGGLAVDLGCGNGWYLRRLAERFPRLRGVGVDGFGENIEQARRLASADGVDQRLSFQEGDLHDLALDEPADLVAMNRALHHVWDEKDEVFRALEAHLKPGGVAVVWEPNWPERRGDLREPSRRAMAFQNLAEHVQGNHFLRPGEIAAQFRKVGMEPEVFLFAEGREAVVTGRKAGVS